MLADAPMTVGNGRARVPSPPADTPAPKSADLQPKYTQEVGGDGGTVCEDKCADGAYITHWKLRKSLDAEQVWEGPYQQRSWLVNKIRTDIHNSHDWD